MAKARASAPPATTASVPNKAPNSTSRITEREIPLDRLRPHPNNYNQHPGEQLRRLRASLETFGQVKNIVAWAREGGDHYLIVAGEGLWRAATGAGWASLRANVLPESTPPEKVRAYLVADNEHARHSSPDEAQLAALLDDLAGSRDLPLLATGYDALELDELLLRLDESTAKPTDADGAAERAPETRRRDQMPMVNILIPVADLAVCEEALAATGARTRSDALATVCRAYLATSERSGAKKALTDAERLSEGQQHVHAQGRPAPPRARRAH